MNEPILGRIITQAYSVQFEADNGTFYALSKLCKVDIREETLPPAPMIHKEHKIHLCIAETDMPVKVIQNIDPAVLF